MPLRRFGRVSDQVRLDGFNTLPDLYIEIEGGENVSMGMSVGVGIQSISTVLSYHRPDYILLIGDRFEALAATISAVYQNIRVIHLQGGESSGSIDESNRHAISKLSHLHFPATEKAKGILLRMGENPKFVHNCGCPVGDIIINGSLPEINKIGKVHGLGNLASESYGVVAFHPNTVSIETLNDSLNKIVIGVNTALEKKLLDKVIWLWPNIDAGSDQIHVQLRKLAVDNNYKIKFIKSFEPLEYQSIIKNAAILIGNSSSFVRDSSFTGTKVLLLGDRQLAREFSSNVTLLSMFDENSILAAMKNIMNNKVKQPSYLYGNGNSSKEIVDIIARSRPPLQKTFFE
jgi:UDP-hydrolysing UDP-N-acetyl-D-glucosamine 2-epimerase